MRIFYDFEFLEDGATITPVSLGMVPEEGGREYYAQSLEFDPRKANAWVWDHVFPQLALCYGPPDAAFEPDPHEPLPARLLMSMQLHGRQTIPGRCQAKTCPWRTRMQLQRDLLDFVDPKKYGKPRFVGYYAAYDHVALCQIFGTMMDLPDGWPMWTYDLKQLCYELGDPRLPEQGKGEHHALQDAQWNKRAWEFLMERSRGRPSTQR